MKLLHALVFLLAESLLMKLSHFFEVERVVLHIPRSFI